MMQELMLSGLIAVAVLLAVIGFKVLDGWHRRRSWRLAERDMDGWHRRRSWRLAKRDMRDREIKRLWKDAEETRNSYWVGPPLAPGLDTVSDGHFENCGLANSCSDSDSSSGGDSSGGQ